MMLTALSYLVIQVIYLFLYGEGGRGIGYAYHHSSFLYIHTHTQIPAFCLTNKSEAEVAKGERWYALIGMIICFLNFFAYLIYQFKQADSDVVNHDKINEVAKEKIAKGEVSLLGR